MQTLLLAQEARRRGLDRDPQVVTAIRRRLSQRTEQVEILEAITPESVTDAEVARHYEQRRAEYQRPEFRRATVAVAATREGALARRPNSVRRKGDMRRVRAAVAPCSGRRGGAPRRGTSGTSSAAARRGLGGRRRARRGGSRRRCSGCSASWTSPPRPSPSPTAASPSRCSRGSARRRTTASATPAWSPRSAARCSARGVSDGSRSCLRELRTRLRPEVHEERLQLIHLPPSDLGALPALAPPQPPAERTP